MDTVRLDITGMHCQHCLRAVRVALERVPGVKVDEVRIGSATVSYDPAQATLEKMTDAVADEGYEAVLAD